MPSYIVVFRLHQTSTAAYSRLSELLITRLFGHCVEDTTWLVDVRLSATKLQEYISGYLDDDETAYVAELTFGHELCRRIGPTGEWIRRHPPLR